MRSIRHPSKAQTAIRLYFITSIITHHLDFPVDNTPEVPSTYLQRFPSRETSCLKMPAQLMKDRFLEISEDSDSRQKVVQVVVECR